MSKVSERHLQLVTIYEVSKILGAGLDLSKTMHSILNVLAIHFETRRGMISLMHESGELLLVGASGMSGEEFGRCGKCIGDGISGRIYQTGLPIVIEDISRESQIHCPHPLDNLGKTVALIGVPIKYGRETLGVISIERVVHDQGLGFDQDIHLLKIVANLIGQTVRLHEVSQTMGEQTTTATALHKGQPRRKVSEGYSLDDVVGVSKGMQQVFAEVHQSAPTRATILLRGESGTGKEVIARAIHYLSPRKDGPFIKVNCAALSETLLESELFGHEKGAFTGAQSERKGRFELADGGTLFLDEIGEVSPAFQAKLLRVLQEREFERVGGNKAIKVNVRLIAATNRDLEKAVAAGDFRADLYFRINVVSIFLPSLRDRVEDVLPLAGHFLSNYNRENLRQMTLSPEAMNVLTNCHWPGNVRELENCVERTATLARGDVIRENDFPCKHNKCLTRMLHDYAEKEVQESTAEQVVRHSTVIPIRAVGNGAPVVAVPASQPVGVPPESSRERLLWALEQCRGVQAKAARLLNISPRQLSYALQKHNIQVRKY